MYRVTQWSTEHPRSACFLLLLLILAYLLLLLAMPFQDPTSGVLNSWGFLLFSTLLNLNAGILCRCSPEFLVLRKTCLDDSSNVSITISLEYSLNKIRDFGSRPDNCFGL